MYIFRNKQFFRLFLLTAILLAGAAIGVFFFSPVASAIVLAAGVLVLLVLIIDARSRYQAMERLSTELDEILHDNDRFLITECEEGELAILSSSIRKMTLKLKEQASKLTDEKKVLTDAIADIFHQMRTPLTSMRLSCSMLSEEDIPYEERIRFVRGIKKQLERMQWLVETLLKMSKIEAGTVTFKKERLDVHELVQKACEPLLIPLELRDIKLKIETNNAGLTGDMDWLAEAIGNIVKNCMEHTPEGGQITINSEENAIFTVLTVEDTGQGFDKNDIAHIFERFYKGKNSGSESVGIGLALSRTIITGLDGTIKAENGKNGGARFEIRFYKNIV
ncbi:MAG: HAMP domain-containing histidine kinase [Lachnospiraceae bacterium]|nr:HAMP domain-containing histidine kinase [Lachnospiraceae bacterium]